MRLVSRKRWATLPAVAALATIGAIAPVTPASADTTDAGVVAATGWVTLNPFPSGGEVTGNTAQLCVNGVGADTGTGGGEYVYADGVADPSTLGPATVCIPEESAPEAANYEPPSLNVSFSYDEPCTSGVAIGFAEGHLTLGPDVLGNTPPEATNGHPEYFFWVRVGLTAIIQISDTDPGSNDTERVITDVDGGAVATFVPLLKSGNLGCGTTSLNAYVAAAGAFH